jgi:hypothetical protein
MRSAPQTGRPQGSVISPLLANIYLHYAFDLWVDVWRKKWAQGDVVVVRDAEDIILGFQHQTEADRFLENFRERLGKFGLEPHPDKTRRIEFGRFAEQNRGTERGRQAGNVRLSSKLTRGVRVKPGKELGAAVKMSGPMRAGM